MHLGIRDLHDYFKCESCGCLQIIRIPDDIYAYYGKNYYSFNLINPRNKLFQIGFNLRNKFALMGKGWIGRLLYYFKPTKALDFLKPMLKQLDQNTRILDVGCGSGALLRALYGLGFKKLKGLDPFIAEDIEFASRCRIEKKDLTSEKGTFDLIMMHHSLEHMPDQFATLHSAWRVLADDGVCVIRVPMSSSFAFEHYQENWAQLDAPRHFYLHSQDSFKYLVTQCGFEVSEIKYDSSAFQFWASEQYIRNIALHEPNSFLHIKNNSTFSVEQIKDFEKQANLLNFNEKGDQAIFYLKKI
jgi:SAM-dependent methyltransferase